jgi:hypothetical protein
VLFQIGAYNNGSGFNNTTSQWTPGRIGIAQISARVSWATMADQVSLAVFIFKNGSLLFQAVDASSGTGGSGTQGAQISLDVPVTAATDYFEIWAEQSTGSNRDITGAINATWATFRMVRS